MKLSIIVPVYNVELYIRQCLESISKQTYNDFECIVVDDGSTDKSGEICAEYALRDSRFRIISQGNNGLAMARKVAFCETKGEYIGFVDSDDYLSCDMFALLMEKAINNDADIVICGWFRIGEKIDEEKLIYDSDRKISKSIAMCDLAEDYIQSYMWNKIFKRNLLQNSFSLVKTKMMEDYACMHTIFTKADSFYYIAKGLYYYRYRSDSITGSSNSLKRLQGYIIARERDEFYQCNYPQMSRESKMGRFRHAWVLCKNYACPKQKEARALYLDADSFIKAFFKEYIKYKQVGKKERLSLWLYVHFTLGVRIWKMLRKKLAFL